MTTFLPQDVLGDLGDALQRRADRRARLRVIAEGQSHQVLRMDGTGFWILAENAPQLRGLVDLYEGAVHLLRCLIVACEEEAGAMRYEFKRATVPAQAPAADFERSESTPAGYLARG